ncbi:hypothetical protein FLP10_10950 [Agromyces intestinalis]|uniref:Uncharacterized protein n=1 Tax=Agromyces intestinalis TaxID=2592652 RepID=A0A5C1YHI4_9MICO|nr:hypothetical protein [Agromyces intestinalis]QEO14870.1 hypothetical protein FLP10_10950 [Agromyces intestinalis]
MTDLDIDLNTRPLRIPFVPAVHRIHSSQPAPACEFSAVDFTATASTSCGVRIIRVAGAGLCPTAGWSLALVAANPGIVPHPDQLWLELRETPPSDAAASVLSDVDVETLIEDSSAHEVLIRFAHRAPITVPVMEAAQVGVASSAPGRWTGRDAR